MDWLKDELRSGFQKLMCLSLPRTPAAELIRGTVEVWAEALTTGRRWVQERDAPRIQRAFVTLATTSSEWPRPLQLIDAMPAPDQPRIEHDSTIPYRGDASPRGRNARMQHLSELLDSIGTPR